MDDKTTEAPGKGRLEEYFRPFIGSYAWSVLNGYGTFLTMEFGHPHLEVSQPIAASPEASLDVKKHLACRQVHVVGDWHFWVQYANWEMRTPDGSVRSDQSTSAEIIELLKEVDGQALLAVRGGEIPHSCLLEFDLGASLYIWPHHDFSDDQWSIYERNTRAVSYDQDGNISIEKLEDRSNKDNSKLIR